MAHPLYHRCRGLVNQPVTLHHRNGRSYHGLVRGVNQNGVYLGPTGQNVAGDPAEGLMVETAEKRAAGREEAEQVFFGGLFFPFALLTGLTLGLAAGALAYPYYGYGGYGFGYGGYGRYYW